MCLAGLWEGAYGPVPSVFRSSVSWPAPPKTVDLGRLMSLFLWSVPFPDVAQSITYVYEELGRLRAVGLARCITA